MERQKYGDAVGFNFLVKRDFPEILEIEQESFDYAWVGWHTFRDLPVNFQGSPTLSKDIEEDYNNTSSIRVGAERRYTNGAALRLGLAAVLLDVKVVIPDHAAAVEAAGGQQQESEGGAGRPRRRRTRRGRRRRRR